jgi:hypothetical protein
MTDLDWVDDYYDDIASEYDESPDGRERVWRWRGRSRPW